MRENWKESHYHVFRIASHVVPREGDYSRWVAEIFTGVKLIFRVRFTITGTILRREEDLEYLENEGLKRVHALIDFGEFVSSTQYDYTMSSSGEEVSHQPAEPYRNVFASDSERLTYHILQIMKRIQYDMPGHIVSSDYNLAGWAYRLGIQDDDFIPLLQQLDHEGLISVIWVPNPERTNSFLPAGGMNITPAGMRHLEDFEKELVSRMRTSATPDLEENAFQIARFFYDQRYVGQKTITSDQTAVLVNKIVDNFDACVEFLILSRYINRTIKDNKEYLSLSADGVAFVKKILPARFVISQQAEIIARHLYRKSLEGEDHYPVSQIMSDLGYSQIQLSDAGQELVDEGLIEERLVSDQADNPSMRLTREGRRAVRRNFRKPEQVISHHYGDQISVGNIGDNSVVAAGRESSAIQGLSSDEITGIFREIFTTITADDRLDATTKLEVKENVELLEEEAKKSEQVNERAVKIYLRNLMKMAPDIFEVVVATIINPVNGFATALRKIAEKAKEEG